MDVCWMYVCWMYVGLPYDISWLAESAQSVYWERDGRDMTMTQAGAGHHVIR